MLVIECKGYGVRRSHTGAWTRVIDGAEQPLRENPFEQAQRHSKELRKILEPRLKKAFPGLDHFPFACGQAVAFPLSLAGDVNLPLDVPWAVVYDAKDLGNIRECVMESFRVRGGAGRARPFSQWRPQCASPGKAGGFFSCASTAAWAGI